MPRGDGTGPAGKGPGSGWGRGGCTPSDGMTPWRSMTKFVGNMTRRAGSAGRGWLGVRRGQGGRQK